MSDSKTLKKKTKKVTPKKSPRRSPSSLQTRIDYLSKVSHDMRTPLNAIIGFSEIILLGKAGKINKEQREYLNDIIVSAKELFRLIKHAAEHCKMSQTRRTRQTGRTKRN